MDVQIKNLLEDVFGGMMEELSTMIADRMNEFTEDLETLKMPEESIVDNKIEINEQQTDETGTISYLDILKNNTDWYNYSNFGTPHNTDWYNYSIFGKLSEEEIAANADNVIWKFIFMFQDLSEWFIEANIDRVVENPAAKVALTCFQPLSDTFIANHKELIDWGIYSCVHSANQNDIEMLRQRLKNRYLTKLIMDRCFNCH